MSDLTYWLYDGAKILRSNGSDTHAENIEKAAARLTQLEAANAQLEADRAELRERLSGLSFRAYEYAGNYLLDERDNADLCAGYPNQHERIVALFDAIEDADSTLAKIGEAS